MFVLLRVRKSIVNITYIMVLVNKNISLKNRILLSLSLTAKAAMTIL